LNLFSYTVVPENGGELFLKLGSKINKKDAGKF